MARGLNRVQLIGNLGADPGRRATQGGQAVATFRVAVNRTPRLVMCVAGVQVAWQENTPPGEYGTAC